MLLTVFTKVKLVAADGFHGSPYPGVFDTPQPLAAGELAMLQGLGVPAPHGPMTVCAIAGMVKTSPRTQRTSFFKRNLYLKVTSLRIGGSVESTNFWADGSSRCLIAPVCYVTPQGVRAAFLHRAPLVLHVLRSTNLSLGSWHELHDPVRLTTAFALPYGFQMRNDRSHERCKCGSNTGRVTLC
jgi:hypothetical protein